MELYWKLKISKKMILAAKKSGADFVKFRWDTKNLKSEVGIMMVEGKYMKKHF